METKPKILYLITQSEWGGAQRYVWDLAQSPKEDFDVSVAFGGNGRLKDMLGVIHGNSLKYLVREINPVKDLLALFEIRALLKKIKPQILHLNSTKAGVLGALAAVGLGIKVVYTAHGWVFLEPLPAWKKIFYFICEWLSCRFRQATIVLSAKELEVAQKYKLNCGKTIVIQHGIDPVAFLNKEEARNKINESLQKNINAKFWIGTIANLYKTKDIPNLIEALKAINEDYAAIIIGDGPERSNIESLIKNANLSDRVFLLTGKQVAAERWLKAFDLFVLPSSKEGFPYAILEAMSAGLPIVATAVGAIPEMIENKKSGLIVPPKNPGALGSAIIELINNSDLRAGLGQTSETEFKQKFSKNRMLADTQKLYSEILE